ncbi:hypothetical protein HK099_004941 [Clydaea vesicula]|uniref:CBS domain-containing protein n=1 Tax=Clydaea vesicula TaxID=447962 RepID=A0AAD5XV95_9FUNG|nr:hypothetical protein HK099_004941 [Clydaea vesicula]
MSNSKPMINEIYNKLGELTVQDLLYSIGEKKKLVSVNEDSTIEYTLNLLKNENLLSLPVYRMSDGEKCLVAMVSIFDILAHSVFAKVFHLKEEEQINVNVDNWVERYLLIVKEERSFFETPVKVVTNSMLTTRESQSNKISDWSIRAEEPLTTLLRMFTTSRFHRALVLPQEKENTFENLKILTQTDFVNFLFKNRLTLLGEEFLKKMEFNENFFKYGLNFTVVPETMKAFDGFKTLYSKGSTGLAVVDAFDKFVGDLSGEDLRYMVKENLDDLLLTIKEFNLKLLCQKKFQVLKKKDLCRNKLHRIWVVDDAHYKPISCISLTTLLTAFVPEHFELLAIKV